MKFLNSRELITKVKSLLNPFSSELVSDYKPQNMFSSLQQILIVFLPLNLINVFLFKEEWHHSNWGVFGLFIVVVVNIISYHRLKYFIINKMFFQLIGLVLLDWCILDVGEIGKVLTLGVILWSVMNTLLLSFKTSIWFYQILIFNLLVVGYVLPSPQKESWLFLPLAILFFSLIMQMLIYICLNGFKEHRKEVLSNMNLVREHDDELFLNLIYLKSSLHSNNNKKENMPNFDYINSLISNLRSMIISSTMGRIANECKNLEVLKGDLDKIKNPSSGLMKNHFDESAEKILSYIISSGDSIQEEHMKLLNVLNDIAMDLSSYITFEEWNRAKLNIEMLDKRVTIKAYVDEILKLGNLMLPNNHPKFDIFYKGDAQADIPSSTFKTLILFLVRLFSDEIINEKGWIPLFIENEDQKELKLILPIKNETLSCFYTTSLYEFFRKKSPNKEITLFYILNQILMPANGNVVFSMKNEDVFIELTIPGLKN